MLPGIALLVLVLGSLYYVVPHALRRVGEFDLRRRARRHRALVLTYDDGPSETTTRCVLELLARCDARATFFMLGRRAEQRPSLAAAVAANGNEVGTHSHQHLHAWRVAPWAAAADLARGARAVAAWLAPSNLLRPPHGKLNAWTWLQARRLRTTLAWWTVDAGDTHDELPDPQETARRVLAGGGAVVLLHDLDREPRRDAYVLTTTRLLLEGAEAAGLQIMTLGELLGRG